MKHLAAWRLVLSAGRGALAGAGRHMVSSGSGQGARNFSDGRRALLLSGAALVGSAAMLVSRSPTRAESSDMEEELSVAERALSMLGLGSWVNWVREPAERADCPPGKLLPDPMDLPPGVVQRTLVLSLEDTLIHTEWDRKFGHRTRKRPGLDAFLAHVSQYYEVVIFTSAQSSYAQPITQQLQDTGAYFQHALFNEHTKGDRIKDLSYLNRDLRHVIIVDTNPHSYKQQKYNGVAIKPWDGDLNDTELLNLVPFLDAIYKEDIQDVREVIRGMEGHNIPTRLRMLKHATAKRSGGRKKDSGLLASIALKGPVTRPLKDAAKAAPAKAPLPLPSKAPDDPPAATAEETGGGSKAAKAQKLFQHRV